MKNSNDKSLRSMCARIGKLAAEIGLAVAIGAFAIGTGTAMAAVTTTLIAAAADITARITADTTVDITAAIIGVVAITPPDPTSTSRPSLMPTRDRHHAMAPTTKRIADRRHPRASACSSDFDLINGFALRVA